MTETHQFEMNYIIKAKRSGLFYRIIALRSDGHRKLKGGLGYVVTRVLAGKGYGPSYLMPEASFEITDYGLTIEHADARGVS